MKLTLKEKDLNDLLGESLQDLQLHPLCFPINNVPYTAEPLSDVCLWTDCDID